ncbi:MAG TPA: DUF983 domain-containing protein [Pyrinomonadaceae bacterium]|nr:DUF983 domain-containing protein [Pyrinomonadaceae bacterium]
MSAKPDRRSLKQTAARCLILRCPECGRASVFERPFQVKHHCSACRALFKREAGFFVGAIVANVLTTELVVLAAYFAGLYLVGQNYDLLLAVLFAVAVLFPVAFYHHSWSIWLAADYLIESLPKYAGERGAPGDGARRPGRAGRR